MVRHIRKPLRQRAEEKYEINETTGCWLWTGSLNKGYGQIMVLTEKGHRPLGAHLIIYEFHKGPIPKGLDLDHLCRIRHCVNPNHLEPVTRKENLARGNVGLKNRARIIAYTHCPNGHLYEPGSFTMVDHRGRKHPYRRCLICYSKNQKRNRS